MVSILGQIAGGLTGLECVRLMWRYPKWTSPHWQTQTPHLLSQPWAAELHSFWKKKVVSHLLMGLTLNTPLSVTGLNLPPPPSESAWHHLPVLSCSYAEATVGTRLWSSFITPALARPTLSAVRGLVRKTHYIVAHVKSDTSMNSCPHIWLSMALISNGI